MRLLITSLMGLSLSLAGLPGVRSIGSATAATIPAATASSSPRATTQGRGKKRRPRAQKVKKAEKKPDKKKNDRGFEL